MRGLLNRKPLPNPLLKGEGTFNIDLDLAENNFRKRSNIFRNSNDSDKDFSLKRNRN